MQPIFCHHIMVPVLRAAWIGCVSSTKLSGRGFGVVSRAKCFLIPLRLASLLHLIDTMTENYTRIWGGVGVSKWMDKEDSALYLSLKSGIKFSLMAI